jgi:hypothetical protein
MQSFHDPKDIELIAKLQFALTEALDQNEIVYLLVYSYGIE